MPLITKEEEIQEELSSVYDLLLDKKEMVRLELEFIEKNFNKACSSHNTKIITHDNIQDDVQKKHQLKLIEYEIYCQIIDIVNDFKDLNGKFPEYSEMHLTLEQIMLKLANQEKYELAAIIKLWVDRINKAIQ
jgi:hypothetical protein